MYEQHWRYMKRIVELGDGGKLYARYNTNLSRVDFRGLNLYRDILVHVRDWQICASIDGTGVTGEYIRTGLDYNQFCRNFEQGLEYQVNRRQMRLDFTLTLPGMFEINNIQKLAQQYGVELLAKVMFGFSPDLVMSPLSLPRHILDEWIDELLPDCTSSSMRDVLTQLKNRPTFSEQWPDIYPVEIAKGKVHILELESLRTAPTDMATILSARPSVKEWWDKIGTN